MKFQNFYDRLSLKIRQIDQKTPICFQPIPYHEGAKSGFTHPPGGKRYQNVSILCYHYYIPPNLGFKDIISRINDGKRLNVPTILSQFGDPQLLGQLQNQQQSWFFWIYKHFGKNWGSSTPTVSQIEQFNKNYSSTYIQKLAGEMISTNYNLTNNHFTAIFLANPQGKSILYANLKLNYKNGYLLNLIPQKDFQISINQQNYFTIQYLGNQKKKVMLTLQKL